jgi:hypothetical protein
MPIKKSEIITTRLTEVEALKVALASQKNNMTVSAYVRNKIIKK